MISIKKQEDFDKVFKEGHKKNGKLISVLIRESANKSRLGMIVSKKFGNAVSRNRIKRVIREAFNKVVINKVNNIDIVVIPRPIAIQAGLAEISSEIGSLTAEKGPMVTGAKS